MRILTVLLVLFVFPAYGQNLLLNNSFEDENTCSEYEVQCAPEAWVYTVPSFIYYFKNRQMAHTGQYFVALIAGHTKRNYYRTFVRSRLLCGLRKGNTYKLDFYIKSSHPILDSFGVYFSDYDFLFEKKEYQSITPSLYLTVSTPKINRKDTGWQHVVLNYTANGTEAFITVGNFSRKDVPRSTGIDKENNFFALLDDINLVPANPKEQLCDDWRKRVDEIYGQDERHEYQRRLMKENKDKPLQPEIISHTVVQKVDTVIIPDILFTFGSYKLVPEAFKEIDSIANKLNRLSIDSIVVEGHTDSIGTSERNLALSKSRAASVSNYFQTLLPKTLFVTRGFADSRPVGDNRTPRGRQMNRRVEIYVYVRQ